ncbi:MAG: hypothetical protein K9I95_13260 [Flavobacteriaceae bacterium]|nr:hypothetical protein [Flavobacteriaceae bacterium]
MILFIFFISCSNNDINVLTTSTCYDGIQNGDETGVDCGGSCSTPCIPDNALEGVLITRMVLSANIEYKLIGPLIIRDGATLEIEAGTVIKAQKNKNAYIAVAQGGKIYIWGNENNPVVITSDEENPAPGDWGGIVICGKAPTNNGMNARSELVDFFYGGTNTELSSGIIKYLRLEYTGESFTSSKRFNAITFYGVGSFTTVENIQAYESLGNGFEIVGGTINAKQLISTNTEINGVKVTGGWNGFGNSWYISGANNSGITLENNDTDAVALPLTTGNLYNMSIIGPFSNSALNYTNGGGIFNIDEIYTSNINLGININSTLESSLVENGDLNINNIEFANSDNNLIKTNFSGSNSFFVEGNSNGAGNAEQKPNWANNWSIGL